MQVVILHNSQIDEFAAKARLFETLHPTNTDIGDMFNGDDYMVGIEHYAGMRSLQVPAWFYFKVTNRYPNKEDPAKINALTDTIIKHKDDILVGGKPIKDKSYKSSVSLNDNAGCIDKSPFNPKYTKSSFWDKIDRFATSIKNTIAGADNSSANSEILQIAAGLAALGCMSYLSNKDTHANSDTSGNANKSTNAIEFADDDYGSLAEGNPWLEAGYMPESNDSSPWSAYKE